MEKPMIQIGLRVPENVNVRLEEEATSIGVSKNALILMLIKLGFNVLDSSIIVPPEE